MESAFEETKPHALTALGKQFVHYVMEDVVPQIGDYGTVGGGDFNTASGLETELLLAGFGCTITNAEAGFPPSVSASAAFKA